MTRCWKSCVYRRAAELQRIREQYTAAEQALQTLTDHTPKEKNALEPLPFIDEQALTDESQLADGKSAAERLNRCREELASLQSRSEKLAAEEAQLLPWESLTMPLECATTEKVLIQMGTLPAVVPPEQIQEALDAAGDLYELREVSADPGAPLHGAYSAHFPGGRPHSRVEGIGLESCDIG